MKNIGKIVIEMDNKRKESFDFWYKADKKMIEEMGLIQINPHYWVIYTPDFLYYNSNRKLGLGQALKIINLLKKVNGNVIINTIPEKIMKIAEREAILLRLV